MTGQEQPLPSRERAFPGRFLGAAPALALVALGLVLRVAGLSEHWLSPDEGIYYSTTVRTSFAAFWTEVMANAHPPAFYLLLRWVGSLTDNFVALRVVPLLGGTAAIWAFWLVGRELGGRRGMGAVAGLVAAGLLAVNPEAILYSQVIRPYSLLVLLLASALWCLLRYRSEPRARYLVGYGLLTGLALLTHYGAVLGWGVFLLLVASEYAGATLDDRSLRRLLGVQIAPALLFGLLFWQHLERAMGSYMMAQALGPGGWLNDWLLSSPSDAWRGFVGFQLFQMPPDAQVRSALLTLGAMAVAVAVRERPPLVVGAGALAVAVAASFLDIYPFGPTRHSIWPVVFTLPVVGWAVARLVFADRRIARSAAAILAGMLLLGGPIEGLAKPVRPQGNGPEEQIVRQADLAPLLRALGPHAEPAVVLMSFESFNVLMPLYANARESPLAGSTPELFAFELGSRRIAVVGYWDWRGWDQVRETVRSLEEELTGVVGETPERVLVVAGGVGSALFEGASELRREGALAEQVIVTGPRGSVPRIGGFTLDVDALLAASDGT